MDIRGTQTEKNLMTAFAGESQARNRYTFFASKARKEGYVQIAQIFEETANQEKEHAKRFFSYLQGGDLEVSGKFPAGVVGTTKENLMAAASGEKEEWTELYPKFAEVARQEGFDDLANQFQAIAVAERQHEHRYRGLLEGLEKGTTFVDPKPVKWRCINCGYIHEGTEAPEVCPACFHPQAYYERLAENW
ncbi:MAG: rubrerythrin family protein [Planctomycetia bacterium]|nr:rubrerythrin family protein [Planctomycetia bacterium]